MAPDGTVKAVTVTKATVETKPWVLEMVRSGLVQRFEGMQFGDDPARALAAVHRKDLGDMPSYFAEVTATAVKRGLAFYGILFAAQGHP